MVRLSSLFPSQAVEVTRGLFLSFATILRNSRPIGPHAVTSVIQIDPKDLKLPRSPSFVIFTSLAGAGVICLAAYIAHRYFRRPSPPSLPPPEIIVTPPPADRDLSLSSSSPAPVNGAAKPDSPRPDPVVSSSPPPASSDSPPPAAVGAAPSVVLNDDKKDNPVQADADSSSSPPFHMNGGSDAASPLPPAAASDPDQKDGSASEAENDSDRGSSPNGELPRPPSRSERSSSEGSSEQRTDSSSSSPARQSSSPDAIPPPKRSFWQRLPGVAYRTFFTIRNFSKWMKYREVLNQMGQRAKDLNIQPLPSEQESLSRAEIAADWNFLVEALTEPLKFQTADDQYYTTVATLRKVKASITAADRDTQAFFAAQLKLCHQLSYKRFAGIEFFDYCRDLVEMATGMSLPEELTFANFFQELKIRAEQMNQLPDDLNMNVLAREWKKLKGTLNIWFDPLLEDNVPYVDGVLKISEQTIRLLRHGVPFYHHDVYSLLAKIPYFGRWFRGSEPVEPLVNPDYAAFIEEARENNENILHVSLENGQKKNVGDESPRVRARLKLGTQHENFFALALNLDSKFFDDFEAGHSESIASLKAQLKSLLTGGGKNPDHLEQTGFCIPEKILEQSKLENHLDEILNEVQVLYFSDFKDIISIGQHQAFILLTYVHVILFLCRRLNIRILEAFCKDDIDRGNVMKTLLKLVFLYLSHKGSTETLNGILVNTLAAPCIVKKQAIIGSRLILIERVIPFITQAFEKNRAPKSFLFEQVEGTYQTVSTPHQSIFPQPKKAKNHEEYTEALDKKWLDFPHPPGNLIEKMSARFFDEKKPQEQLIRDGVLQAAKNNNLYLEKTKCAAQDASFETIFGALILKTGSKKMAWQIAASMQDITSKLHELVAAQFDNPLLKMATKPDETAIKKNGEVGIFTSFNNGCYTLSCQQIYTINNGIGALPARIKAKLTIPDHRTGQAQLELDFC